MKEVKGRAGAEWVEGGWHMHKGTLLVPDTFEPLNLRPDLRFLPRTSLAFAQTQFFRWLIRF